MNTLFLSQNHTHILKRAWNALASQGLWPQADLGNGSGVSTPETLLSSNKVVQSFYYLLNMSFDGDRPARLAWNISWVNCPFK